MKNPAFVLRANCGAFISVWVIILVAFVLFPMTAVAEDSEELNLSAEEYQLAQVPRRRPGGEEPKRRERKEEDSERVPAATTPTQAMKQRKTYQMMLPPIPSTNREFFKVPNRWTMLYDGKWYDPYNQNIWKGDLRMWGTDEKPWFLEIEAISDTLFESRRVPTPVSITSTKGAGRNDVFGGPDQTFFNQNLVFQMSVIRGNTTFRPPDYEIRIAPIINFNYADVDENGVLRVNPSRGSSRKDSSFSLLAAFVDIHLADLSDRYDFVSFRAGVQEFNADFRGLVFIEEQPGLRLFGNYDNNKIQWNLAYFHRLKKDANSLLPILFESKDEDVHLFNVYMQDLITLGHQVEFVSIYREDTQGDSGRNFDENGFETSPAPIGSERPKNIRNTYLGLNSDGHFGRWNITSALYWAFGSESHNPIADRGTDINAFLAAAEVSWDVDWYRPRVSAVWASGDSDPFDDKAEGFDAIFDNPNLLGGEDSYWVRQGIPFIGGGGVALTDRSSFLPDLRAGKAQGQSNFVNPGLRAIHAGLDVDIAPKVVWINNIAWLSFDETAVLEAARQDGKIDREIGLDVSTSVLYRPLLSNNIQIKAGYATLLPGNGFKRLYGDKTYYQFFTELTLLY